MHYGGAMEALIYTRVSQDRAEGRSPAEQEREARAQCEREGWEVVEVITDSVGASRHSKGTRDGWGRVQQLLASGRIGVLVTWEASRATRDLTAYAELRDLCAKHGVRWSYSGRTLDLSDGDDRFRSGLDALLAEREADEIAKRVRRAIRENASAGRPHGRRLYGYQRTYNPDTGALVGQEPHPDEAPAVRHIFDQYLAGRSLRTIARRLNEAGSTTSTGAAWTMVQVRRVLANPAYVARRVHQGEVVGPAGWKALVDEATFDRAQARLESRVGHRQPASTRLLTGVARCSVCGGKLHVGHDRRKRKLYQCRAGFCVARDLRRLDAYVIAVALERLSRPDIADALDGAPDPAVAQAKARAAELRAELDDAMGRWKAKKLSVQAYTEMEAHLLPRITEAEREARRAMVPVDVDVPGEGIDAWWDGLGFDQRRSIVGALISAVVVHPVGKGRRGYDPAETTAIEWRR